MSETALITVSVPGIFISAAGDFKVNVQIALQAGGFVTILNEPIKMGTPAEINIIVDGVPMRVCSPVFRLPVGPGNSFTIEGVNNAVIIGSISYT